jgi:hypothetical protein
VGLTTDSENEDVLKGERGVAAANGARSRVRERQMGSALSLSLSFSLSLPPPLVQGNSVVRWFELKTINPIAGKGGL